MPTHSRVLIAATAAIAAFSFAGPALAEPAAGEVEVLNEAGVRVGPLLTGTDAVQTALAVVRTGPLARADDALPWSVVAGAGTYGDVLVDEPNLTVRPALTPTGDAAVTISGTGGADATGLECVDITRGGVTLKGIRCRTPSGRGVEVILPPNEGGVTIQGVVVDRPAQDGFAVNGGAGFVIQDSSVITPGADGIRLERLTGPGPYRVQGGSITRSADDGIDLVDDVQRLQVVGVTIDSARTNGIESDDAGSSDLAVDGATITRSGDHGVILGGGGTRLSVANTTITGSSDYGVVVTRATGTTLRGLRFNGTNVLGDVRFSAELRTGGVYDALDFGGAVVSLPGDPVGVILSALTPARRAALTGIPPGLRTVNRFVRVRDTGGGTTSAVRLRFLVPPAELAPLRASAIKVYEDDPTANRRQWQEVAGSRVDVAAGAVEVDLTDRGIASGSDGRFATYGPLGPPNGAPEILGVLPLDGATARGRDVAIRARVRDEEPLSTGSFLLEIDGVRRGGVSFKGDLVQFRPGRLRVGLHRARLVVVDANRLVGERSWTFAVINGAPRILLGKAKPRRSSLVLARSRTTISVPVRDDLPLRTLRASMRVDGKRVAARVVGGRVVGRVALAAGRHRVIVAVRDRDGATTSRRWSFRVVR
jgi:Right handed beta helix region